MDPRRTGDSWIGELTSINPVARAPAWFAVLGHLGADSLGRPVFRALTVKGNLANRALATKRGDHKKGGGDQGCAAAR
ncbi:hypothetical protein [Streptomyces peucetius]|uniref:Uncharacterized protein n=1 Tax=Streptomyces peucetius TaxID=1950 RepID=A0ABY6I448_STRPE|nr:hypothetical protein [Streptomyces peucetius]UYQ60662.1 hypothetical protein OGH68_03720 [Streptomyces peucetius]